MTPQGSSANLLFAGSGYLSQGELYRLGAITTAFNLRGSSSARLAGGDVTSRNVPLLLNG